MKTIVQIGTANAEDHVLDYIKEQKFDVFGIFIEPNPYSIAHVQKQYKDLKAKVISNIAISNKDGSIDFYLPCDFQNGNSQIASVNLDHLVKHGNSVSSIYRVTVPCYKLNSYLNRLLGFTTEQKIDTLFIDTEGHDCDIILSTDFSLLSIDQVFFEIAHTDGVFTGIETEKFKATNKHLNSFGFSMKEINKEHGSIVYGK